MIPVNRPALNGNEINYVNQALEDGWISDGPFLKKFEDEFSKSVNRDYGISVSNGTAALYVALQALEIGPGDEVILPTHTIISCIMAVLNVGATPVLVDMELDTWNMDCELIESKITKKTKALMAVHIFGHPCDMDKIEEIVAKYNLFLIEDAAEMAGQFYREKPCGSFGHISTFSFYANKVITTGEGGMVLTDNPSLAERCKYIKNLCFNDKRRFVHEELGNNFRMTNIQAAIGCAQLEQKTKFVEHKREIGRIYTEILSSSTIIECQKRNTSYSENIYWVFGILISEKINLEAKELMDLLGKSGVGTRPFFWPLHKQPVLNKMGFFKNESYPVADSFSTRGLYLPSGTGITLDEVRESAEKLMEILTRFS